MNRRVLRIIVPLLVSAMALGVVGTMLMSSPKSSSPSPALAQNSTQPAATAPGPEGATQTQPATAATQPAPIGGLRAIAPRVDGSPAAPESIGSLDPRKAKMQLDFNLAGAGLKSVSFANIWETADAARQATRYLDSLASDQPIDPSKLDEPLRSHLQTERNYSWTSGGQTYTITVPILAAHSIIINGTTVPLLDASAWAQTAPGSFESRIVDESGRELLHISRQFSLGQTFDIAVLTDLRNVSGESLEVRWQQYGPIELNIDRERYIDRRRFSFGFLPDPKGRPDLVLSDSSNMVLERTDLIKRFRNAHEAGVTALKKEELLTLWPNELSRTEGYDLSWFATCNRYFTMAVHPALDSAGSLVGTKSMADVIESIRIDVGNPRAIEGEWQFFTFFLSPARTLQPDGHWPLNMNVYGGPLERQILDEPPYSLLAMNGLILYQMSTACAFCTFQWLAHGLLWFLSALHAVTFDWGISIIGLVLVVRLLLHPITKRSQINMQRFGKQMQAMKPEIEKLQKKYPNDTKKVQQEQMRLMREHGINPLQMLGCLPMFLQMPIWIALYAMLYFAFDLRQQPAFYGIFQLFWGWPFLADLSAPDRFIPIFNEPRMFTFLMFVFDYSSINLLPLLMGLVFYFQQKYMSPPPSPTMTKEQLQQQAIMKWMMVILFPLMLYSAPSGLTLYIATSTCFGILESKYVRAHIDQLDLTPKRFGEGAGSPGPEPKKSRDPIARAWAERLERARAKRDEAQQRSFKKRK